MADGVQFHAPDEDTTSTKNTGLCITFQKSNVL
jgi:hypothetical protein